jgi:hypothetical protein
MNAQTCCPVVELRQYTLKPAQRDVLIELFEREFIEKMDLIKRTELCRTPSRGSHDGDTSNQVLKRVSRSRRILCCGQPLGIMARQIHLSRIDELIEAMMKALKDIPTYLLVCTLVVILQPLSGLAQQNSDPSKPKLQHLLRNGMGNTISTSTLAFGRPTFRASCIH